MSDFALIDQKDKTLLESALSNSLIDVIGTTTGFGVNNYQVLTGNALQESQVIGFMFLSGEVNALLAVTMSNQTAATLVAYMTGILPEDLSVDDIHDGVSELINMVSGSAKSLLKDTKFYFRLTTPFTVAGENRFMVSKGVGTRLYKQFHFDNMEINLIHQIL